VVRGVITSTDMLCALGCDSIDSVTHLFLQCTLSADLWALVWHWLGISFVHAGELRDHFIQFTRIAGMPICSHIFFRIIWFATIWVLWKERNSHVFQNIGSTSFVLIEKVKLHSFLWLKSKQTAFAYTYHDWWKYPIPRMGVIL